MNKIVLTNAGIAELINAEQTGTTPVVLTQVGLGTGQYTADATRTALAAEIKRLSTISGGAVGDNVIHLFVTDASSDAYTAYEVGIYTASGTLFGVVSSSTEPIVEKAAGSTALLAIDFVLTNADPASVTVGDTNFVLPPATTEMQGIVELATAAEVQAGTDTYRAVTPYALAQRTANTTRKGLMRFATVAESETGTNTDSAVTPAGLMAVADKYLPLAGGTMTGQIKSTYASVPISFTNVGSANYRDVEAKRSDTNKRIGALRFNTTSTTNSVSIGASDAMDNAPSGVTVTRTLGDGTTAGTVTITVSTTPATTAKDKQIATTEYVKNCLPKSIGSATKLTYTNGDGVLTASNSTVGATNKPVFLNSGSITAISDTIGSTTKPVYINGGALTATNATVGSATKPMYLNAGVMTECSSSLTDYLPLAGGTMSGQIKTSYTDALVKTNDTGHLTIIGGSAYSNGASILLRGKSESTSAGGWQIRAKDASDESNLIGTPAGELRWNSALYIRNNNISRNGTANWFRLNGGQTDYTDGASLILYGKTHSTSPGEFGISAFNGTNRINLVGRPDGTLKWNTANILTAANYNSYALPLAGGTMTGAISRKGNVIRNTGTTGQIQICGGDTSTTGARLELFGEDDSTYPSAFLLMVRSAKNNIIISLLGKPDGTLTWGGNNVVRANASGVGSADVPVYINSSGVATSTGKSFANYLPLTAGSDNKVTGQLWLTNTVLGIPKDNQTDDANDWVSGNGKRTYYTTTTGATANISNLPEQLAMILESYVTRNLSATDRQMIQFCYTNKKIWVRAGNGSSNGNSWGDWYQVLTTGGNSFGNAEMVGALKFKTDSSVASASIVGDTTNHNLVLTAHGTTSNGPSIVLWGTDAPDSNSQGCFNISAYKNSRVALIGYPSTKILQWAGYNVITEGKQTELVKGTNPSATTWCMSIKTFDSIGTAEKNRLHEIRSSIDTNGASHLQLLAYDYTSNATASAILEIVKEKGGNGYASAPTPSTGDNSTKIATTAFVRAQVPASLGGGTKLLSTNANGVVTESTSSVGSASQSVYLDTGEVKACTMAAYNTAGFLRQTEQSLNTDGNGYVVLNAGLKLQWGTLSVDSNVTFSKPFTKVPVVTLAHNGGDYSKKIDSVTTTGFRVYGREQSAAVWWFAIGR